MSLTGIRDLTLLNTPPADRQPILTYVGEYDERAVAEAIRRELLREGQVFYVHNRVRDIERRRRPSCASWCPRRAIAVAHGQMDEGTPRAGRRRLLGGRVRRARVHDDHRVRHRHADGEHARRRALRSPRPRAAPPAAGPGRPQRPAGLRLPLPPPRPGAHRGGLRAAAHDRRGHRAGQRASRSPCATSRSAAPATCSASRQSGHIAAVGYDLYCQMVNEAVAEMKGEPAREPAEVKLDVPVDAHLPRRLRGQGRARGSRPTGDSPPSPRHGEVDDIRAEWEDRYGPVPGPRRGPAQRRPRCGPSATASACTTSRSPRERPDSPRSSAHQRGDAPQATGPRRDLQGRPGSCRAPAATQPRPRHPGRGVPPRADPCALTRRVPPGNVAARESSCRRPACRRARAE